MAVTLAWEMRQIAETIPSPPLSLTAGASTWMSQTMGRCLQVGYRRVARAEGHSTPGSRCTAPCVTTQIWSGISSRLVEGNPRESLMSAISTSCVSSAHAVGRSYAVNNICNPRARSTHFVQMLNCRISHSHVYFIFLKDGRVTWRKTDFENNPFCFVFVLQAILAWTVQRFPPRSLQFNITTCAGLRETALLPKIRLAHKWCCFSVVPDQMYYYGPIRF